VCATTQHRSEIEETQITQFLLSFYTQPRHLEWSFLCQTAMLKLVKERCKRLYILSLEVQGIKN